MLFRLRLNHHMISLWYGLPWYTLHLPVLREQRDMFDNCRIKVLPKNENVNFR